jgi:hypothetical protein
MAALSSFASDLLEEAKRFLEKAQATADLPAKRAYLHAALMVGFAAFEAHVNAIADDFLSRDDLDPHERGLLAEHVVELVDGEFQEKNALKIQRLEDRVQFLCRRFSKTKVDRTASYWGEFVAATKLRNELTHPKAEPPNISEAAVTKALKAIIEFLNFVFKAVYKKKLPAYNRGLASKLSF